MTGLLTLMVTTLQRFIADLLTTESVDQSIFDITFDFSLNSTTKTNLCLLFLAIQT